MLNKDGLVKKTVFWLAICSILEYSLYHIEHLFSGSVFGDIMYYIRHYLTEGFEFIIPALVGTLMLIILTYYGWRSALLFGALASISRLFYFLPWYYMHYIYNMGFDSLESIFFSFLTSVGFSLLSYLECALFFGVAAALLYLTRRREKDALTYLKESMPRHDTWNVTQGCEMLIGSLSLLAFLRRCIVLTADTISFFLKHGSSFRTSELLSIVIDYLLALIYLIVAHLVICRIKKRMLDARLMTEKADSPQ